MEKLKVSTKTIARTIILFLALINQILAGFGISIINISDSDINIIVSTSFTIVAAIISWWKDNDVTQYALKRKKVGEENVRKN